MHFSSGVSAWNVSCYLRDMRKETDVQSGLSEILKKYENELHKEWMAELAGAMRNDTRISQAELSAQTGEFLSILREALSHGDVNDLDALQWEPVREFLEQVSRFQGAAGLHFRSDGDFHFFSKEAAVRAAAQRTREGPGVLVDEIWLATEADRQARDARRQGLSAGPRGGHQPAARENCWSSRLRW